MIDTVLVRNCVSEKRDKSNMCKGVKWKVIAITPKRKETEE